MRLGLRRLERIVRSDVGLGLDWAVLLVSGSVCYFLSTDVFGSHAS